MISLATKTLLAYSMLKGVGPAKLRALASARNIEKIGFGSAEPVGIPAIDRAIADKGLWGAAQDGALRQIDAAERMPALIISAIDPAYPSLLTLTKDDPFILFVRGTLPQASTRMVAVIGTREPTRHGEVIANRLTEYLVSERCCVVSGLALGCDSIAHEACVRAGGQTIAVLAHGLQTVAPATNRRLAEDIVQSGGALLTEYPFGVDPIPQHFVRRDSTQAGLSAGVVMVQSDLDGGSLHAARASLRYGRWLAVPSPTDSDRAANARAIRANLVIADGDPSERARLLECLTDPLDRVRVLRTKDDYPSLLLP